MRLAGISVEAAYLQASVISTGLLRGSARQLHAEQMELPADAPGRTTAVKELLLKLKRDFNIRQVVFGLGLEMFSHRFLEMPAMKKEDMRGALHYELEKYLPLPPDEYVHDFISLGQQKGRQSLLLLALRADALNWIKEAASGTGLRLAGIRCSFIETINGFLSAHKKTKGIFAHSGKGGASVAVLEDALPKHFKSVPASEAQKEIERLRQSGAGDVFVCGEQSFNQALAYKNVPMSVAFEVAASALKRPLKANFTPAEGNGLPNEKTGRLYTAALWSLAGLCLAFYFLTPVLAYYKDYSAAKDVRGQIEGLKQTAHELIDIRRELEDIRQKKEFLLNFQQSMNRPVVVLAEISRGLPADSWLANFSIDEKGKVEIGGFSKKSALLISPLEKSPLFKKVEFSTPVVTREGMERFSIKMELEQ